MNRGYSREEYLYLTEKIRSRIGECSLSTDILIGFPGETEKDFEDTLRLLEEVGFDDAFTYKYNPREGTAAASYADQVSEADKTRRLSRLIDLQRKITEDKRRERIGKTVSVLVEGLSRKSADELLGRTERNEMVVFPRRALSPGDFVHLRLENLSGVTFRAKED